VSSSLRSPLSRSLTVHVVEDDPASRDATTRLLRAAGHFVRTYSSATDFLDGFDELRTGCIVLDLRLPGPDGLELQRILAASGNPLPIVFLTGYGEVPDSVRAMKSGAVDFLDKMSDARVLLDAVSRALMKDDEERALRAKRAGLRARYGRLTPRERDVFAHLISGQLNKQIGFDLGISEETVKIHRHRVLVKMEADSAVDLARMATDLAIPPIGSVR
jgi:FixJ family two-component response regulator